VRPGRPAILVLPALLALLVFAPALGGGFVHDDGPQVVRNPMVQDLRFVPVLWRTGVWAGAGSGSSWYRPLMTSSFAVDRALFGPGPLGFHATQLLLFVAAITLFVALTRALGASTPMALAAGALAAVHPVQAESAAWISARGDVLAATAGFAALLLYERALRAGVSRAGWLRAGAGLAFFLALAAKESAAAFALAFVVLDRVRGAPMGGLALAARHAGWLVGGLAYASLRRTALGEVSGGLAAPIDPLAWLGFVGQGALRLVWPVDLTIAPLPPGTVHGVLGAGVLVGIVAAWRVGWRRRAPELVPLALLSAALPIAALGAVRVGELGDRYLLLPACAVAWIIASGVEALAPTRKRAGRAALALAVAACALLSIRHVSVYESDERLWRDAWRKNPQALRAPMNLAAWHLDRGEATQAIPWLERAAALAPGDPQLALNRAVAAEQLGDRETARRVLRELVASDAGAWPVRLRLAHLELDAGRFDAAAEHYEAILGSHSLGAEARAGLGVARHRQGRDADAAAAIDRALSLDPDVQNAAALRQLRSRIAP
jgi:tetratricopeptide (TPR) repeat protein